MSASQPTKPLPHASPLTTRALEWVDRWCERIGDRINPILVKEARQALKSRQFVFTFGALLLAALAWTIIGSLSMMPQIYTSPTAPRMLIGYYFVLAVPMLLVVPMAAYRSLEAEIDDGTLELLSISALRPWQIVLGKLLSAMLQMTLYFVALFPCVAYAYNLRGVDLPTTLMMLGLLLAAAATLTIFSLFLAANSSSRTGRITALFVVMGLLLTAQVGLGEIVVYLINFGNPLSADQLFVVVTMIAMLSLCAGHLLLATAAAQLTPESENRSTTIRVSLMVLSAAVVALGVLVSATFEHNDAHAIVLIMAAALALLWLLCGSIIVAESPVLTPRIHRELPQSFLARCTLTYLTPGPATGFVFVVVVVLVLTAIGHLAAGEVSRGILTGWPVARYHQLLTGYTAYLIIFLALTRAIVALIRTQSNPRAEIGVVVLLVLAVLASLIPYSIGLHLNDYRSYDYSLWQVTNWYWTLGELVAGKPRDSALVVIGGVAAFGFCVSLIWSADLTLPRRTATPQPVLDAE